MTPYSILRMAFVATVSIAVMAIFVAGIHDPAPEQPKATLPCAGHYNGERTWVDGYRAIVIEVKPAVGYAYTDIGASQPIWIDCNRLGS